MLVQDDWSVSWTRAITSPETSGVLRGTALVAADADGIVVAAPLSTGIPVESVPSSGVHLLRLTLDGTVMWERRFFAPGLIEEDRYRPGQVMPTALVADEGGILLATRTTSFGNRWYAGLAGERAVQAPWVLRFDADGELLWQRFVDPRVGNHITVHAASRTASGWLLGGDAWAGAGAIGYRPFVATVSDDGLWRTASVLDDTAGGSVRGWSDPDGERIALVVSNSGAQIARTSPEFVSREIVRLSSISGRFLLDASSLWYVGQPPPCSDFPWTGADTPWADDSPFCAATRRHLAAVRMPRTGDRGCSAAVWARALWGAAGGVGTLPIEFAPSVLAMPWGGSEVDTTVAELGSLPMIVERLCVADPSPRSGERPRCLAFE